VNGLNYAGIEEAWTAQFGRKNEPDRSTGTESGKGRLGHADGRRQATQKNISLAVYFLFLNNN